MSDDLSFIMIALPAIFFVVDPFAAIPIFAAITAGDSVDKRKSVALRASIATVVTLTLFAIAGGFIFKALGISLGAFKMAGGLMVLLMAVDMMRAQPSRTRTSPAEQADSVEREDVAIVPLAIPMLAGPGAMATVAVLVSRAHGRPLSIAAVFVAILITGVVTWLLLRAAASAERFIARTTLRVIERLMGLLLAAVAVEFMTSGLVDLLPRLRGQ
jgi:multiple antibiotic resistance protein